MAAHEIVIRLGRPFDVQVGTRFTEAVREVTVPFADRQSAEDAQRDITVFVRQVHDAGGEDYRPVVAGEVVKTEVAVAVPSGWRPVVKCVNCGRPVKKTMHGHWTHWGFWEGRRCPGDITGAEPGEEFGEDEYHAWVQQQIGSPASGAPAEITP